MTIDYVNSFLVLTKEYVRHRQSTMDFLEVRPALECEDGLRLSVQASEHHYSNPRENTGPYAKVEVMILRGPLPESVRGEWQEIENDDTVYGYVAVDLINRTIEAAGGIKELGA